MNHFPILGVALFGLLLGGQEAFYDTSKNRSGAWCSMAGCGSRLKARAYRHRRMVSEKP